MIVGRAGRWARKGIRAGSKAGGLRRVHVYLESKAELQMQLAAVSRVPNRAARQDEMFHDFTCELAHGEVFLVNLSVMTPLIGQG
jgi:hypothetical protein